MVACLLSLSLRLSWEFDCLVPVGLLQYVCVLLLIYLLGFRNV